jgi:hypothetical protein
MLSLARIVRILAGLAASQHENIGVPKKLLFPFDLNLASD